MGTGAFNNEVHGLLQTLDDMHLVSLTRKSHNHRLHMFEITQVTFEVSIKISYTGSFKHTAIPVFVFTPKRVDLINPLWRKN